MANTRILQVFQCDKRDFAGSGRIKLPLAGTHFFSKAQAVCAGL
jgi:hypothetical protein